MSSVLPKSESYFPTGVVTRMDVQVYASNASQENGALSALQALRNTMLVVPRERTVVWPRRPRRWRLTERERNLPAAILSIIVIATLSTALVHPRWFYLQGGGCGHNYLGVQQFFYVGYFETAPRLFANDLSHPPSFVYYGLNEGRFKVCSQLAWLYIIGAIAWHDRCSFCLLRIVMLHQS